MNKRCLNLAIVFNGSLLFLNVGSAVGQGQIGSPYGGKRTPADFGDGSPFARSSFTAARNAHVPGISNGKGLAKHGFDLDLSSNKADIKLAKNVFKGVDSATINVGGTSMTFSAGDSVTAGQLVALLQVLREGNQTLILDGAGAAVGGTFFFNKLVSPRVNDLVIPENVTAFSNIGLQPNIGISGDFTNLGTLYTLSTESKLTHGLFLADNITNNVNAVISSDLPPSIAALFSGLQSSVTLTLAAKELFINSGTITSSGGLNIATAYGAITNALPNGVSGPAPVMQAAGLLNLSAGSGVFNNAGLISSLNSNVQFASPVARDIVINGLNGTVEALNGAINVRHPDFDQAFDITINGGTYNSLLGFNLYSGLGDITGFFSAPIFSTQTSGLVDLENQTTTGITVLNSTGGSFNLETAGSTTLNSITTSNGSITVSAAGGLLETTEGVDLVANNGSITLINEDTSSGSILIGTGTNIETTGTGGPVRIVIGSVPANPQPGSVPTNVQVNVITTGSAFFGTQGIVANGPLNTLNLKGANIVFDTGGLPASAITLDGSVTITADPPAPSTLALVVDDAQPAVTQPQWPASTTTQTDPMFVTSASGANESANLLPVAYRSVPTDVTGGARTERVQHIAEALRNDSGTLKARIHINDSQSNLALKRGENAVVVPRHDTMVSTDFASIKVDAKSCVLVMVGQHGTAVYNLDDRHRDAVTVQAEGQTFALRPGTSALVSSKPNSSFAELNPIGGLGYRGLKEILAGGKTVYTAEFSLPGILNEVGTLKAMISSSDPAQKQIGSHLLKTTALIHNMYSSKGRFQKMLPRTVALK